MPDRFFAHPTALVESREIGDDTRIWAFAHVMKGAVIGRRCNIGDHSFVEDGAIVGDEVTIKNGVSVWAHVTLERRVFLGPNVALTNDARPRSRQADWTPVATVICEGATVGANATIVCGSHVGRFALVGAGAVVTRPVPAHALVVGNPARVAGYVCCCGQPLSGRGRSLACRECGAAYVKTTGGVAPAPAPTPTARGRAASEGRRRKP